jgi:hypothetical protein
LIFVNAAARRARSDVQVLEEITMQTRLLTKYALAALDGAAMLTLAMEPASALPLASPSLQQSAASAQIEKIWWHRGWHHGWGWHHHWRHCWRGYYGHLHCNW